MSTQEEPKASLFPEKAEEMVVETIAVADIYSDYAGDGPSRGLVASIKRVGLLVPLIVQPTRSGASSKLYNLVDGRRRFRAIEAAGITHVKAVVIHADVENPEVFTLQANLARKVNPISEFFAIRSLIDKGHGEWEIATKLGIKPTTVGKRLALSKLTANFFDLVATEKIPVSVGELASGLPASVQESLLDVFAQNGDKLTQKDVIVARRAQRAGSTRSLSSEVLGDTQEVADAKAALHHLEALSALALKIGVAMPSFKTARSRLTTLID